MENKKCLKPPTSYNHWHLNWCPSLGDFAPFGRLPRPASQVHRLGGHSLPFQAWPRDSTGFTIQKSWYSGICISMHCIHVCIHIYIHIYIYTYIHIYIYTYIHIYIYTYIHIYIYTYIHIYIYTYIYIHIYTYTVYTVYMYILYIYIYCVYVYTVYIYTVYIYIATSISIYPSIHPSIYVSN